MKNREIQWKWLFPEASPQEERAGNNVLDFFKKKKKGYGVEIWEFAKGSSLSKDIDDCLCKLRDMGVVEVKIVAKKDSYCVVRERYDALKRYPQNDEFATSSALVSNIEMKYPLVSSEFNADKIKNNKKVLIEYLENIIGIFSSIYSLQKRYNELYIQRKKHLLPSIMEADEVDNVLSKDITALKKQISDLESKISDAPCMKYDIKVPAPSRPRNPEYEIHKPAEPLYTKPGFFNKKKITAQNEALRIAYEKELAAFYVQKERLLCEYNEKLKSYEAEMEQCKAKEEHLNKEAYEKKVKEFKKNKENWLLQKEQLEKKLADVKHSQLELKEKLLSEKPSVSFIKKAEYEMLYISSLLEKLIKTRNQLWGYEVVYGKYREYVIITTLCDYLKSGRCDELEGPNGAYNLYESESRADIVINQLDAVITSLEAIKQNQFLMYSEIKKVNQSLNAINGQLFVSNLLNVVQVAQLDEIAFNTKQTAYNTAVTAYYSEKNAQLTKALLFTNMLS